MLIQFKDRDYLISQQNVEPQVNLDMLVYAENIVDIPDDQVQFSGEGWLRYNGWVWHKDWYDVIVERAEQPTTYNINYTLKDTNHFVDFLRHTTMPDALQHITINTDQIKHPVSYAMGTYMLNFVPDANISQPILRIKFSDTSEYNLSNYYGFDLNRLLSDRTFGTRVHEDRAKQVVVNIIKAFVHLYNKMHNIRHYVARFKNGTKLRIDGYNYHFYNNVGLPNSMVLNTVVGDRSTIDYYKDNYDLKHILRVVSSLTTFDYYEVGTDDTVSVNPDEYNLSIARNDADHFYIGEPHGTFLRVPLRLKDIYAPDIPLHKCPVLGIWSAVVGNRIYSDNEMSPFARSFFTLDIHNSVFSVYPAWPIRDISEEAFTALFNEAKPYVSPNDSLSKAVLSVYVDDTRVNPELHKENQARNEGLARFNLVKLSYNKYKYFDRTFWTDDDEVIQEYDYENDIQFFGERDDLHLGVELEVDKGGESHYNASIMGGILGFRHTYFMHDGSLNDGFEMATQPMTLDYHMSLEQNYKDAFGVMGLLGYKSHNTSTCGLHIHFDRHFFGRNRQTQNLKASYLALIMEKNWEKFVQFSRRDYSRLDQWAKKLDLVADIYADDTDEDAINKFGNKYGDGDKYVALNTNHSHTYELRIFRGTLKPETYLATLQFVDNLVRVAKECTSLAKAQQITFADIINYKPHTHLVDYITSRGILTRDYIEYKGE